MKPEPFEYSATKPERFELTSLDHESCDLVLIIDYDTFLALGFDGYDAQDLRAFIRQSLEQGKIAVQHAAEDCAE